MDWEKARLRARPILVPISVRDTALTSAMNTFWNRAVSC